MKRELAMAKHEGRLGPDYLMVKVKLINFNGNLIGWNSKWKSIEIKVSLGMNISPISSYTIVDRCFDDISGIYLTIIRDRFHNTWGSIFLRIITSRPNSGCTALSNTIWLFGRIRDNKSQFTSLLLTILPPVPQFELKAWNWHYQPESM